MKKPRDSQKQSETRSEPEAHGVPELTEKQALKNKLRDLALSRLRERMPYSASPSETAELVLGEMMTMQQVKPSGSSVPNTIQDVETGCLFETAGNDRTDFPKLKKLVGKRQASGQRRGILKFVPPEDFWKDDDGDLQPATEETQSWYTPLDEFDRLAQEARIVFWPPQKAAIREELRQVLTREAIWLARHGVITKVARSKGKQATVNADLEKVKSQIREMKNAGFSQQAICNRLGNSLRPPQAAWRDLPWPKAYRESEYNGSVKRWLSSIK